MCRAELRTTARNDGAYPGLRVTDVRRAATTVTVSDFYCDEVFSGRANVNFRHEDDVVVAFDHTQPAYELAHVVVVPRRHVRDLLSIDDRLLAAVMEVVRSQAQRLTSEFGACRVITNLGDYQDSKHLHWHVVSGDRLS